jgi:hypothetical protein
MLAIGLHGLDGVRDGCPSLEWDGARYRCKEAEEFSERLYIGIGCCSPLNSWRQDVHLRGKGEA